MADDSDLTEIREQKKAQMAENTGDETTSPDSPVHVDGAAELQSVADDHDVVLVDFHAEWCGPCKMLEPVVADLASETPATVAKVDVDRNQQLAGQYGVQGVPTLVLFADGEAVEKLVGVKGKEQYASLIEQYA
jgi:thioredoxin 1